MCEEGEVCDDEGKLIREPQAAAGVEHSPDTETIVAGPSKPGNEHVPAVSEDGMPDVIEVEALVARIEPLLASIAESLESSTSEKVLAIVQQFGLAFAGALLAFLFALWLAKRQRVTASTEALINEFSSREMLKSRFATVGIADKVSSGAISLEAVASSSLQGTPKDFVGDEIDGLSEHQHMSHVIGFYRRLALSLRHGWVNQKHIERSIGGSLHWTLPFLMELSDEVETLAEKTPTGRPLSERAAWVFSVRYVASKIDGRKFEVFAVPKKDYSLTHAKNVRVTKQETEKEVE